ncbi:MAG: DHA2 family efflux MFS transporter permease subunit [Pseudomonadota bacterium]|nr:DHA2 family efflux MFS transporter permease subunit [Pseudomonadota bacterium]
MNGAGPGAAAPRQTNRAMITVVAMMATTVVLTDQTIAAIALPHMQGGLSASQDQISWVMTTYFMAQAVTMAATGWLAGRIGRKQVFIISLSGFAACAILSGNAESLGEILFYRAFQGVFSAPVIPISQALMLDSYPPEQHGKALSIWGVGVIFAPVVSPVIGGWLTEDYGWEWIFYVSVPFAIFSVIAGISVIRETPLNLERRFDWTGFIAIGLALGALQLMLDRGTTEGWFDSTEIVIEALIVVAGFYFFVVHSLTTDHPFISPAIFADRNMVLGLFFMLILGIFVLSMNVVVPLFLQNLRGYPVLTAGLIMAPRGIGSMISLALAGWLMRRFDSRLVIAFGFLNVAFSSYLFSTFTLDVGVAEFVFAIFFNGAGVGLIFVPLTAISFITLPPHLRTEGSTLTSQFRVYGAGIGISVMVSVLSRTSVIAHAELTEAVNPYNPLMRAPFLPQHWTILTDTGRLALEQEISRQASSIGFLNDFNLLLWGSLISIPMLLLLRNKAPA